MCTEFDVLARFYVVVVALCIVVFNEPTKKSFLNRWALCQNTFWSINFYPSRDTPFEDLTRVLAFVYVCVAVITFSVNVGSCAVASSTATATATATHSFAHHALIGVIFMDVVQVIKRNSKSI